MTINKGPRAYVGNRFVLELGEGSAKNPAVGLVHSVDGGNLKSDTVGEQVGPDGLETRYAGRKKFDDLVIEVGTTMSPEFWTWVNASINGKYQRRNGAIVVYDFDGAERSRRTFMDAVIAEVQFPALDAASKAQAFITVKIAVEEMKFNPYNGASQAPSGVRVDVKKQKMWVPSNYRFRIDGLDDEACKWVKNVDALTVKQAVVLNPIGYEKYVRKEVGRIDQPAFSVSLPERYSQKFVDWWDKFVADMDTRATNEKTGAIEYLGSDMQEVLMSINLHGIGITGITFDKLDAGQDSLRNVKVDLYCEKMDLALGAGTDK